MSTDGKCLVIGGGGFIGIYVVRCLSAHGFSVRVFDRNNLRIQRNLDTSRGIELVKGDLCNIGEMEAALDNIENIVFLAHTTVPATSMSDPLFDLESNIPPLVRLLHFIREKNSIRRFIYISSGGTIYGNTHVRHPIGEKHSLNPISSYGLTKLIAEHYLRLCFLDSSITGYVLRPSNAFGKYQNLDRPQGAVGHFLNTLSSGSSITLYGDGSVVRDYIYAYDIAEAIRLCLQNVNTKHGEIQTFNVGSGRGVSLMELINIIQDITGKQFKINRLPERKFDCRYNVLDCSSIKQALGWQAKVTLEEGIQKTWNEIEGDRFE